MEWVERRSREHARRMAAVDDANLFCAATLETLLEIGAISSTYVAMATDTVHNRTRAYAQLVAPMPPDCEPTAALPTIERS